MNDTTEYKKKLQRIHELDTIIQIHGGKTLLREQKQAIETLQGKMEFRLGELVQESRLKELDIKIAIFEEMVTLLHTKHA